MPEFNKRKNEVFEGDLEIMFGLDGLEKRLQKLDGAKAMGRDKVSQMVLKNCAKEWARAL